jgi:hypothetical protein
MKLLALFIGVFYYVQVSRAQGNLVPNPGFEIHTNCPSGSAQFIYIPPWVEYNSADYYDTCSVNPYYDIPKNYEGFQYAHSGTAYCGLISFINSPTLHNNYREFIQVQLLDTLKSNVTYCVRYYVNIADTSGAFCSNIGTYFSSATINPISWTSSFYIINFIAQAENNALTNPIADTSNWVEINYEYVAQGGERYVTIGNFRTDSNSTWQDAQNGSGFPFTYLFLDDVSIHEKVNADIINNYSICNGDSIAISTSFPDSGLVYQWSPSIYLSDSTSAQPWAKPTTTTTYTLTISDPNGLYCIGNSADSVTITVNDCTPPPPSPAFSIPTLLTGNELFYITSLPINANLELYDSRGRLVYKENNYQNNFNSEQLVAGVYLYQLSFPDGTFMKGKICKVK